MSEETPPPIPPQTPAVPHVPQPQAVDMKPRWIMWVLASVIMPALPWLTYSSSAKDGGASVIVMTVLALLLQLAASIAVAIGFSRRRALGVGGVIGMSIVFMLASVAIGSATWFATCLARAQGLRMKECCGKSQFLRLRRENAPIVDAALSIMRKKLGQISCYAIEQPCRQLQFSLSRRSFL